MRVLKYIIAVLILAGFPAVGAARADSIPSQTGTEATESTSRPPKPDESETTAAPRPPGAMVVFVPSFSSYSPDNDYARLFREDLERHWRGRPIELRSFPEAVADQPAEISRLLTALADEPHLQAVIVAECPVGCFDGLSRLRARRPDLFVIAMDPREKLEKVARAATLTVALNHAVQGYLYPTLAHRMGARTLVYFSFPRHLNRPHLSRQYRILTQATRDMNMILVSDIDGPDPRAPGVDRAALEAYLEQAVERYLDQYGPKTAFITTSTLHSDLLVPIVMRRGGRALPGYQSSLLLGFPEALGMEEEARSLFGQWRDLLALEDEKIMADRPAGEFAVWTYPYPHSALLAVAEITRAAIDEERDIYDIAKFQAALGQYAPGVKWLVTPHMDYTADRLVPQVLLLLQDSYWFGHGYQGTTWLNMPNRYYHIQ